MTQYVLGIDIGTTSVKTTIVNINNKKVEADYYKNTQSQVVCNKGVGGNIQDVSKIISALNMCISKLPKKLLGQISSIGMSCQMHGVVLWTNNSKNRPWTIVHKDNHYRYDIIPENVSHLYTWQDGRCDQTFLSTLPVPNSHINAATGFGVPTIFWLSKNEPDSIKKYDCAGTIGDFVVAMLANIEKPFISEQNAASWGYFDCTNNTWNKDILEECGFPVGLLPDVKLAGNIAGYLTEAWHTIPKGTPIGVAMGDLQCSILSCVETSNDAVLNLSTSAQITYIAQNFTPSNKPFEKSAVEFRPYFDNSFIAVAASLNGGNSLATFVQMIQQWVMELGFQIPQANVWEKVLLLGSHESAESNLVIRPTCLGERHAPEILGEIKNITKDNLELGTVFRSLCKGLIENLHNMMPSSDLNEAKITRILGNGNGLTRNVILQKYIEDIYKLPLVMISKGESSTGAAIAMSSLLESFLNNISRPST